ncbi:MAG: HAD-IC family P-type ATPase [Spirochaetales bacterium]|nr:HAD-IC family P-type ATPase [Spirochaetales bacterium]
MESDTKRTGLTSVQVAERVKKGLSNRAARQKTKTVRGILVENIFSVFNFIILGIIIFLIIFFFRDRDWRLILDSAGVFLVAFVNTVIAIFQELKAKHALDKVSLLLKKEAVVIRDGREQTIPVTDIVVDDLVVLRRGDQTVVDGSIVDSVRLEIDESLLTGESVPIEKKPGDTVLSGSFCVAGRGVFMVEKVGHDSYASSVTGLARKYKFVRTPLQKRIDTLIQFLFVSALILVCASVLGEIFRPRGLPEADFVRSLAAILISLVPQGLVLFTSVAFALGVFRISRIGAIVQKLNAIESFSNVRVVCADKTGTLTENRLSVHIITNVSAGMPDPEIESLLGSFSEFSTEKNATIRAINGFPPLPGTRRIDEYPFSSDSKMSMLTLEVSGEKTHFVLGAYDLLLEKFPGDRPVILKDVFEKNELGIYRNLLFLRVKAEKPLEWVRDNLASAPLEPLCFVSIKDTVRRDVYDAIALFAKNDIKVKVLSGDAPEAIAAVLREIGWDIPIDRFVTGQELDGIDEKTLDALVLDKEVFARLKPEHKLSIVRSLKRRKIYTAMLGDGVNDLPAIKEANMGIAMEEGSSITKEVADIVLLKNKFSLLPEIFNEGNKIINSVSSVAKLFLTKNFMVILMTLFTLFFLFEFPLTPRRVSLLNMFGIGIPALLMALLNKNVKRYPYFIKDVLSYTITSASVIVAGVYASYYFIPLLLPSVPPQGDMVMMTVMIVLFVANFVIISLESGSSTYSIWIFGVFLAAVYILFTAFDFNFILFRLVKEFYEINTINPAYWIVLSVFSLSSCVLLFFLHFLRNKFFLKETMTVH